jgi:hypothetical protein
MQWKRCVLTLEFDGSVFNAPHGLSDARRSICHARSIDSAMISPHSSAHSAKGAAAEYAQSSSCPTPSHHGSKLAHVRRSDSKPKKPCGGHMSTVAHSVIITHIIMPTAPGARSSRPHRFFTGHTTVNRCTLACTGAAD